MQTLLSELAGTAQHQLFMLLTSDRLPFSMHPFSKHYRVIDFTAQVNSDCRDKNPWLILAVYTASYAVFVQTNLRAGDQKQEKIATSLLWPHGQHDLIVVLIKHLWRNSAHCASMTIHLAFYFIMQLDIDCNRNVMRCNCCTDDAAKIWWGKLLHRWCSQDLMR